MDGESSAIPLVDMVSLNPVIEPLTPVHDHHSVATIDLQDLLTGQRQIVAETCEQLSTATSPPRDVSEKPRRNEDSPVQCKRSDSLTTVVATQSVPVCTRPNAMQLTASTGPNKDCNSDRHPQPPPYHSILYTSVSHPSLLGTARETNFVQTVGSGTCSTPLCVPGVHTILPNNSASVSEQTHGTADLRTKPLPSSGPPVIDRRHNTSTGPSMIAMHAPPSLSSNVQESSVLSTSSVIRSSTVIEKEEKDPRTFDGKEDVDGYLAYFNSLTKLNCWDYATCGLQLNTSLTGKAAELLTMIPENEAEDFTCLVRALLQRFRPHVQDLQYSVALMERSWQPEMESVTDYCHDLRRLARKAYPAQGVPECFLVDLFRNGLNHEMQQQINVQRPRDLGSALAIALAMEPFHKRGHKKSANTEFVSVAALESMGSSEYRSYQGQGSGFSGPGKRISAADLEMYQIWKANRCFLCFELGHNQNDCPKQPKTCSETGPRPSDEEGDHVNDLN